MNRRKKIGIGIMAFIAAFLAFAAVILPSIVRTKAIKAISESTGRSSSIGSISINPLTLTLTVNDFALEEKGHAPLFSVSQIRASLGLASLFKRALILKEVSIEKPAVSFARTAPNRYSFSDIIDLQQKLPPKKGGGGLLFSVNNITIRNGSLDFNDAAISGERKHTVRNLDVGIPFISNIPYLVETYTSPRLTALVDGTPFTFNGKMKPLSKSMETLVHIGLERLSLPRYLAYAPVPPPANLNTGLLTVNADLSYRISADRKPELALNGIFRLDDVVISLKNGKPLVKLPLLEVKASKAEVLARRFALDSVAFDGLEVFVSRDRKGEWMYKSLLPAGGRMEEGQGAEVKKGEQGASPSVLISSFAFRNGSVHFSDALPKQGFSTTVSDIEAAVKNFSTAPGSSAEYELSLLLDNDTTLETSGTFSPTPLTVSATAELGNLHLEHGWPYLDSYLSAQVKGRLNLSTDVAFSHEKGLAARNGTLLLKGLSSKYGSKDRLDLATLAVKGASYSQKENRLEIEDIGLSKGSVSVTREADGAISLMSLFRGKGEVQPAAASGSKRIASGKPVKAGSPLSYRIRQFHGDRLNLAFTDNSREDHPDFRLNNTRLTLSNLNGPNFSPAALRFSSTFGKDAPIAASGNIVPDPFRYSGSIRMGRVPLTDFAAYIPDDVNVTVIDGYLDADMKVDVAMKAGKPIGSFKGSAGVRSFHTLDSIDEEDLLKWESLQFEEIDGNFEPFSLGIRQVALNNVYSRIIVRKDGTLNLQNLVDKPESPREAQPPKTENLVTAAPAVPLPVPKKRIAIGAVTIQSGTIAFTDLHLPQAFSSTFYNLGGRVSGLSSEDAKFADVDLRGNLDNHSPLQITGRINPLREDLLVDLKVAFRDIELPSATPYSETYLGYAIDQGKLFLDLNYLIEKKQLTSENKVFIDQFTFGNKVESEKATSLPVRLAVGLLKDRKGEIHLDLPVTGRTDDPKFSIWGVVWQMLRNLLVKAATSPLSLLSSMVGSDADLNAIAFDPGVGRLAPSEADKLRKLAKALADRPGIRLEVGGFVDREKDAEGYRNELLKKKMKGEKFLQLVKEKRHLAGQSADSLEILPGEYSKLLKTVYEKEKFAKPRNFIGILKTLPDAEMTKLILANITVGDDQLKGLAHERCSAVMAFFTGEGKLPQERVFEKLGNIYEKPKREDVSRGRVELGVMVK